MSIRTLNAILLAGALSVVAMSAAYATEGPGNPTDNTGRSHASAALVCGEQCPAFGDRRSGRDNNGRSRSARMANDGPPTSTGSGNGRSAALSQGGGEFRVAGGHSTSGDF
jgi:hypothetical protein